MADASSAVLSVRVSPSERALLETAAKHARTSLGDFIQRTAIEAAETHLLERRIVTIPAGAWDKVEAWAVTPPKDVPALRQLSADSAPVARRTVLRPLTVDDDRYAFDCGRVSLNRWFWHHAWQDQETDMSRTSVVCDPATGVVIGYVSLSLAKIESDHPPDAAPDNCFDPLPAILLSRLAIDQRSQRLGYARSLALFALSSAVRVSKDIGCFCMLTHPLDDDVRAIFRTFGFEDLPRDPAGGIAVRIADLEHNGFA